MAYGDGRAKWTSGKGIASSSQLQEQSYTVEKGFWKRKGSERKRSSSYRKTGLEGDLL